MKTEIVLISILALAGLTLFMQAPQSLQQQEDVVLSSYVQWKSEFGQNTNGVEDSYRFTQFTENYNFIQQNNAKNSGVTLGLTKFAAMGLQEYKTTMLTYIQSPTLNTVGDDSNDNADKPINWYQKGAVNPVQDQGNCGSCWAFSVVSSVESLAAIESKNLQKFSEQQVTSCDSTSFGCNGGYVIYAFEYTADAGLELESTYPYAQLTNPRTQPCEYNKSETVYNNKGGKQVKTNSPNAMKNQLKKQPISIGIDAGNIYFQLYSSGILSTENCGTSLDHAVAIVGWVGGATPYWIVKNSWGTSWGIKGVGNVAITEGKGVCGVNQDPSYPY